VCVCVCVCVCVLVYIYIPIPIFLYVLSTILAPHGVAYPPTIPEELYDSIYRAESPAYPPIDGLTIAMPSPRRNRKRPSAVLGRSQNCSPPPALRVGKSSPSPGIQEIEEREEGEEGEVEDPISSTRSSPVASVA